jgi:hypothetical protein
MKKLILFVPILLILFGCAHDTEKGISQKKAEKIALADLKKESNMEELNKDGEISEESLKVFETRKDKVKNIWIVTISSNDEGKGIIAVAQYEINSKGKIIGTSIY